MRDSSGTYLNLLRFVRSGEIIVTTSMGKVVTVDADSKDMVVFMDTLKSLELNTSYIRKIFGLRSTLRFPRMLYGMGWRLTFLLGDEPILIAGRGVSSITDHVHFSLKHVLDLL